MTCALQFTQNPTFLHIPAGLCGVVGVFVCALGSNHCERIRKLELPHCGCMPPPTIQISVFINDSPDWCNILHIMSSRHHFMLLDIGVKFCQNYCMASWVMAKNVFCKVKVTSDFDPWPPSSNQFILKCTSVFILKKFPQSVLKSSQEWDGRIDNPKT